MHKTQKKKDNVSIYDQKELVFDDKMTLQHQKIFKELQQLSQLKAITTFFNINDNNWVTAFKSLNENLLCYIDPFGAAQATESKMLTNVNKWMVALNRPKLNILHLEQTIQNDTYNCGVYSCIFMKQLLDELNNP